MIAKIPKRELPPCVYCSKPAMFFAPVPMHVDCPRKVCKEGVHVIAVNQPVCADCTPEKEWMKTEIEYQKEEVERQDVWAARELLMFEIFGSGKSPNDAASVAKEKYGRDITAKAWGELQSELEPMARVEE